MTLYEKYLKKLQILQRVYDITKRHDKSFSQERFYKAELKLSAAKLKAGAKARQKQGGAAK